MGESAGPNTSFWRGSRPTPKAMNTSAEQTMVSSAYLVNINFIINKANVSTYA